jgi:hypothetical protein
MDELYWRGLLPYRVSLSYLKKNSFHEQKNKGHPPMPLSCEKTVVKARIII